MTDPTYSVLLVDDEQDLLLLMQASLRLKGYHVTTSHNGDDLLDTVQRLSPDAILLDLQMAGIDGSTICHLLRHNESTSHTPVVILSGNPDIKAIAEECGAHAFIAKPFNVKAVDAEIQRLLKVS